MKTSVWVVDWFLGSGVGRLVMVVLAVGEFMIAVM